MCEAAVGLIDRDSKLLQKLIGMVNRKYTNFTKAYYNFSYRTG